MTTENEQYREALLAVDLATNGLSAAKVRRIEAENNEMAARNTWICAIEALAVINADHTAGKGGGKRKP